MIIVMKHGATELEESLNMDGKTIAIIGLGLIGASLARAFKNRINTVDIIGIDSNEAFVDEALSRKVIDKGFVSVESAAEAKSLEAADIIFVCTPVLKTVDLIKQAAHFVKPGCIITDTGSTKGSIIKEIESINQQICFVGGHPMAGTENSGFNASKSHLFENAYYILTPCRHSTREAIETLSRMVSAIGSIPIVLSPDEHDLVTGTISHIPHIISAGLVNIVKNLDSSEKYMQRLAAGGFKDITRISSSSPEMWQNVILSNKTQIKTILTQYMELLDMFCSWLDQGDSGKIYDYFATAREFRSRLSDTSQGLLPGEHELMLDVEDKPGVIGEIATILGNEGINIKNINVSNSREFEQGCLRILLDSAGSCEKSYALLSQRGYKIYKRG